ncbi:glycosyltransferase family A protein [Rathayibacter sp. YIM 133350]|uniref:glycosyltransferase family 2 protein n=1 Tax=Rathayibacter sp. YIM 133350 TaxID=3131992 RepID=UPI00307F870C
MTTATTRSSVTVLESTVNVRRRPDNPPRVSVVIPCYNYARYLPHAIGSVLGQEFVDVDVVVVDDASSDDSVAVAKGMANRDARVRVLTHTRNAGPVQTFNDGLAEAEGEYLVRLDADDLLTPGSLARATAFAESHPTAGLIYGHPVHFSDGIPATFRGQVTRWVLWEGRSWLDERVRRGCNCITSPEVLMRKSVVEAVGGQRALPHAHDMEMWMRIARSSDVGWLSGCDQAWHREHAGSLSVAMGDVIVELEERHAAFETLFGDGVDPVAGAIGLKAAKRSLAAEALGRGVAAYARGRGGTPETQAYEAFARGLGVDVSESPESRMFALAVSLGPSRAVRSARLIGWAARRRLANNLSTRQRWRTGL